MKKSLILLLVFILCCCSSKKDVIFLQDIKDTKLYNVNYKDIIIRADDILKIEVYSQSPELTSLFNYNSNKMSDSYESVQLNGYRVDYNGFINLPILNKVKVDNLTTNQLSSLIQNLLIEKGILLNPTVDVKIVNAYFTVLGEVNKPGRYSFIENDMNLLQAVGMAGDLTINGERKDIKLLRRNGDEFKVTSIDITSSDIFSEEAFQIFPDDIIIVNPNNAKVKNAGVISNSGNLLSVLSFILTSIILITNN